MEKRSYTAGEFLIEELRFKQARAFIEALDTMPLEDGLGDLCLRSPWVFRGQADAGWELIPTAWREDGQKTLQPIKNRLRLEVEALFHKCYPDVVPVFAERKIAQGKKITRDQKKKQLDALAAAMFLQAFLDGKLERLIFSLSQVSQVAIMSMIAMTGVA